MGSNWISSITSSGSVLYKRFESTPIADRIRCTVIVLLMYVSSGMMFFGMNFFIHSFSYGANTFVSLFIPAVFWAIMFLVPLLGYRLHLSRQDAATAEKGKLLSGRTPGLPSVSSVSPSLQGPYLDAGLETGSTTATTVRHRVWGARFVALLCTMGLVDALGGLTAVYAALHVPVLVQALLIAGAPMYTFVFAKIFFPTSVRPITVSCVLSAVLLLGGIGLALVPQIQSPDHSVYVSAEWLMIYVASAMLPALLNVVQGRFLSDYTTQFRTPIECKMTALCGDTFTQVFITATFLPLDALPHFGASATVSDSWTGFVDGTHCIFFLCDNTFAYFLIYVLGMYFNRISFTYLNYYNPTVGAVVGQLTQPINTCLLLLFPTLNVFGQPGSWWCTLGCFLLTTGSMLLLIAWHEAPATSAIEEDNEGVFDGVVVGEQQ
ncbi:membrane-associated protein, putative [Bodo saltans]|uniref:Membrane-associated protein, putative n=1 Tax=Bodo saltans TaxID=75058 RepID=A0A0S4JKQ5_BODSA|nr:membrane-associated protein, putative [Bodo saltans]|eukprot:CUG89975.1 membrane-associated protein, putative [Bodo saltans]